MSSESSCAETGITLADESEPENSTASGNKDKKGNNAAETENSSEKSINNYEETVEANPETNLQLLE